MDPAHPTERLAALRVAVVGDVIADHYIHGLPARLSREAPVMVLSHQSERWCPGGAANVARNALALGASVRILGHVGRDSGGRELVEALERAGLAVGGVETVPGWATPVKTRVLAGEDHRTPQQVLRIDREPAGPAPRLAAQRLAERVSQLEGEVDVVLLSDYGYGALVGPVAEAVAGLDRRRLRVVLDPRASVSGFGALDAITPNLEELARLGDVAPPHLDGPKNLSEVARRVGARAGARLVLATLGNRGMALVDAASGEFWRVPASGAERVVDVSGAGDTAAAAFALRLAAGVDPVGAMEFANAAAGLVVMEMGTAVPDPAQLRRAMEQAPRAARGAAARESFS